MIASFGFGCGFVVSNWDLDSTLPSLLLLIFVYSMEPWGVYVVN